MKKVILSILFLLTAIWGLKAQGYYLGQVITNPDGSKGVVFYLNDEGTDGWMVALHDASIYCPWGPHGSIDGLNNLPVTNSDYLASVFLDLDGYEHTQSIRTYCESIGYSGSYAAGVVDFDNGWYLPSAGQLKWLYINAIFYEPALQSAGGEVLGLNPYWSSSVQTDEKAWGVHFGAPYPQDNWAWNGHFRTADRTSFYDNNGRSNAVRAIRNLDFSPTPIIGILQSPDVICDEGPIELVLPNLHNADSYGWEIAPDRTFAEAVVYNGQSLDTTYNGWYLRLWATNEEGTSHSNAVPIAVYTTTESHTYLTNCDPYLWNDSTYTQSGVYQRIFTNAHGCDSVATLHLTIGSDYPISDIEGPEYIYYNTSGFYTYSIDSVPEAYGYEWRIDNDWPLSYSSDATQCTVDIYSKGQATLTVRIYNRCGYTERSLLIHHDLEPGFKVFPNPTDGKFKIHLYGMEGRTSIEIFNPLGELIDRFEVESVLHGYTFPCSLTGKAAGVYTISVTNDYLHYYQKLIKDYPGDYGTFY